MAGLGRRKCRHCRQRFVLDKYNARHQRYCGMPACRHASKVASHRRWLAKNPDYFRGSVHCLRVRRWRACHPYYWRRCRRRTERDGTGESPSAGRAPRDGRTVPRPRGPQPCSALQDPGLLQRVTGAAVTPYLAGKPPRELVGTCSEQL